jgi:hypothetical protein
MNTQRNTPTRFEEVEALIAECQSLPARIREAVLACDADRLAKLEADRRLLPILIAPAVLTLADECITAAHALLERRKAERKAARQKSEKAEKALAPYLQAVREAVDTVTAAEPAARRAEYTRNAAHTAGPVADAFLNAPADDLPRFEELLKARMAAIRAFRTISTGLHDGRPGTVQ